MRGLIEKILKEEMVSMINNFQKNTNLIKGDNTLSVVTLIGKDGENGDKLYLFVSFKNFKNVSEYSYSFLLVDEHDEVLGDGYMTERNEVESYIPQDIKNKRQIFPIIKTMTRKLMDEQLPQNIYRKTVESIDGDSLKRYEEITNIMVNEYGYTLVYMDRDKWGQTTWKLTRGDITDDNKGMDESYEITHTYTIQESLKSTNDCLLPLLKNYKFEPIFTLKSQRR